MKPRPLAGTAPRRWLAHPRLSLMIGVSWLLLQGSLAPVHWIWASILGLVLPWLAHDFIATAGRVRKPATVLRLTLHVLWDIIVANLVVARLVLDPSRQPRPSWVRVAHGLNDQRAIMLLATIITTTPGTVSCLVEEDRGEILVHALDAPDPNAVVADILQRYAKPLKEIFE